MGGKLQREKDMQEARAVREQHEAEKKRKGLRMLRDGRTIKDVVQAVRADYKTVRKWKDEVDNG